LERGTTIGLETVNAPFREQVASLAHPPIDGPQMGEVKHQAKE